MNRLFFVMALIMESLSCFSQAKAVKAIYYCEMKIPEKVRNIENEQIRKLAIQKMQEKNQEYMMYFYDGTYGFSPLSGALQGEDFIVGGERSVFVDMKKKERIAQEMIMDKAFIVKEPFSPLSWTISSETKTVSGKTCIKAVSDVGETALTAWFCEDIPIQAGPAGYCGLPGLIMEIETGNFIYSVRSIEYTNSQLKVIPPSKGEVLSREKFSKMREKKLKEMGADSGQKGEVQIIRM